MTDPPQHYSIDAILPTTFAFYELESDWSLFADCQEVKEVKYDYTNPDYSLQSFTVLKLLTDKC